MGWKDPYLYIVENVNCFLDSPDGKLRATAHKSKLLNKALLCGQILGVCEHLATRGSNHIALLKAQ